MTYFVPPHYIWEFKHDSSYLCGNFEGTLSKIVYKPHSHARILAKKIVAREMTRNISKNKNTIYNRLVNGISSSFINYGFAILVVLLVKSSFG